MRYHAAARSGSCTRRNGGFTLVEMVISIVLIGILAVVGSSMIADSFTTARMVSADSASTIQAQYALERLAREIREIKFDNAGGSYCITAMSPTNLAFHKSTGAYDTNCATNAVTVTINSSGANLTLGYSSPAVTSSLSGQVSSFALAYYDNSGSTTASAASVRFVQITLTLTDPTSGQAISQRTRVALRNA